MLPAVRSTPELQHAFLDACGTRLLSQHRGAAPCTPGCTWVHAAHFASDRHASWHNLGSAAAPIIKQKPRGVNPGVLRDAVAERSEPVVQAGAQDVGVERNVVANQTQATLYAAVVTAEIDIEIFDLGGPIGDERGFKPTAERPAGLV
jgi:hypothetical protein